MIYQAALVHTYAAGGLSAAQEFDSMHAASMRDSFYEEGLQLGLPPEQAAIYARAFDAGGYRQLVDPESIHQSPERWQAVEQLASVYAERDSSGEVTKDGFGMPLLKEEPEPGRKEPKIG